MTLEELLRHFQGITKLILFNKKEDICDSYEYDEIPEDWLFKKVVDWEFSFGTLQVDI